MDNSDLRILDLKNSHKDWIEETANILYESFKGISPAWPTLESALEEVQESLHPDKISRIAILKDGTVAGWIGGISTYDGNVWELHPLVVKKELQGKGIGRMLVRDLEHIVRDRGGLTIWLGTDDENNATSLSGVDLYENTFDHIKNIENRKHHPYEFYQKLGFSIVGVMPDANGFGKPDIYMAKRVAEWK
jgi:aminoglycoside 6'-N-acetyltransferase I